MRSSLPAAVRKRRLTIPVLTSIRATMAPKPAISLLRIVSFITNACSLSNRCRNSSSPACPGFMSLVGRSCTLLEANLDHLGRLGLGLLEHPLLHRGHGRVAQ